MGLFGPPDVEKMEAKRDIEGLIKALGDENDWNVRSAAAEALGKNGDARAVEPLIAALKDEEKDVRSEAARALGNFVDDRAFKALRNAVWNERDNFVRKTAAQSLNNLRWRLDKK